ncbi:hypothetical protein [Brevundimonas sp.]|uniref:hypothetical protein n=1 Tax=Brevundimonas sp. TaxID=1871086 RepID=UPI002FCB0A0E
MILFALLLALAPQSRPEPDPLAPARGGRQECLEPDMELRTCTSLVRYEFRPDGGVVAHQELALQPGSGFVMRASIDMYERDGQVCFDRDYFGDVSFTRGGRPVDQALSDYLLVEVDNALAGDKYCSRYSAPRADGTILNTASVDGALRPDLDATVLWVAPGDGYRVAP